MAATDLVLHRGMATLNVYDFSGFLLKELIHVLWYTELEIVSKWIIGWLRIDSKQRDSRDFL